MKKSILSVGIAMLFVVGSVTFIGCGNDEHNENADHHEHAEGNVMEHEEMNADDAASYACPMHSDITGKKGDTCSECGMDLEEAN